MHAVIRRYRVRLGTMEQAARYTEKWFLPLVRQIPGFRACYLTGGDDGVLSSVGLFETAAGATAASTLATEWFRGEWSAFRSLPPEVITGEVLVQAVAERRVLADRRQPRDRRSPAALAPAGADHRSGQERRSGMDRRVEASRLLELRAAG